MSTYNERTVAVTKEHPPENNINADLRRMRLEAREKRRKLAEVGTDSTNKHADSTHASGTINNFSDAKFSGDNISDGDMSNGVNNVHRYSGENGDKNEPTKENNKYSDESETTDSRRETGMSRPGGTHNNFSNTTFSGRNLGKGNTYNGVNNFS
ncbi:hypothetical protein Moror_5938 [Moniliophthora roreri MCA 2997]|uniref:Uncharacterized protein n=1 Tax=Moniliophthora roreri (strain MCA 2997) TaxID=1381753 RepID=V2WUV3_MONRO|nr:hypothetical protein Moror_5938 [Moniliophthora roreri MCA 2997]